MQPLDSIIINPSEAWPSLHAMAPPPPLANAIKSYATAHNGASTSGVVASSSSSAISKKGKKINVVVTNGAAPAVKRDEKKRCVQNIV